jgi:hypothetical protein
MNYSELTEKHLSQLAAKIAERVPDDTGGAASSLEVDGNKLLGNDYIYYLDRGRAPGKFPPIKNIQEWVRRKLGISDEKEAKQVAYLVGRKIARDGTEIFRDKTKGIQLDMLVSEMLDELTKELPEAVAVEALTWL